MLIHYGVPEGVSLACGAVGPVVEDDSVVVGGCLDLLRLHNLSDELRDGVMHCLFNSMNGLVWDDFSEYALLSFANDTFYFDGVRQMEPTRIAGDRIVQRVLRLPSFCLVERESFFQDCHIGWTSVLFSV